MSSPFVLVIFGATGDLARNKMFPALLRLYKNNLLGDTFYIVGFSRRELSDDQFREFIKKELKVEDSDFFKNVYYQQGMFGEENGYQALIKKLKTFDDEVGACITRIFYLATPPDNYETILDNLESTKLSEGCGQGSNKWTRIAIEKPFGKDLQTAQMLDKKLSEIFEEKQIFRVDHYLGKETVQNMIAFRFANGIFEPVWNKEYIDHVQITMSESTGVGSRGMFYDGVGALRDVGQNHLMQLVAAVAMEQPKSFSREDIRDARANVIKAIACIDSNEVQNYVVSGQYQGYKEEKSVASDSNTETYIAMKFFVDTPRFAGIPFYVRAGKKMRENRAEINIVFKQVCHILFKEVGCPEEGNVLTIRIQPDEGIRFRVIVKKPGSKMSLQTVNMEFTYKEEFGENGVDAYERILLDIISGDQMLFNRSDELESSWTFITNILKGWKDQSSRPIMYEQGSNGPKEANELIEKDNRKWI